MSAPATSMPPADRGPPAPRAPWSAPDGASRPSPNLPGEHHHVVGEPAEAAAKVPVENSQQGTKNGGSVPQTSGDRDRGRHQREDEEPPAVHRPDHEISSQERHELVEGVMAMLVDVGGELTALKSDQPTRRAVRPRESLLERASQIVRIEKGKDPGVGRGQDQGPPDPEHAPNLGNGRGVGPGVLDDLEHHDGVERTVREGEALDIAANGPEMGVPASCRCQGRRVDVEPNHRLHPAEKVVGQISAGASDLEQTPSAGEPGPRHMGGTAAELLENLLADYHARHRSCAVLNEPRPDATAWPWRSRSFRTPHFSRWRNPPAAASPRHGLVCRRRPDTLRASSVPCEPGPSR